MHQFLNPQHRLWTHILPILHFTLGVAIMWLAFTQHTERMSQGLDRYDFSTYYGAARAVHAGPGLLYDPGFYDSPVLPEVHAPPEAPRIFMPKSPPVFALLVYPLGFFSYFTAYVLWFAVTLGFFALQHRQLGALTGEMPLKRLLQSLSLGTTAAYSIMLNGQVSAILACILGFYLLHRRQSANWLSALLLAVALGIKPHLFLPLLLFAAGMGQWRLVLRTGMCGLALAVTSLPLVGMESWRGFFIHLREVSENPAIGAANYTRMINFRGMLSEALGLQWHSAITTLCLELYVAACASAFAAGRFALQRPGRETAALAAACIGGWFFSPWLHVHDAYLLLPLTALLIGTLSVRQLGWLLLPYALIWGAFHFTFTCHRLLLLTMLALALWQMRARNA